MRYIELPWQGEAKGRRRLHRVAAGEGHSAATARRRAQEEKTAGSHGTGPAYRSAIRKALRSARVINPPSSAMYDASATPSAPPYSTPAETNAERPCRDSSSKRAFPTGKEWKRAALKGAHPAHPWRSAGSSPPGLPGPAACPPVVRSQLRRGKRLQAVAVSGQQCRVAHFDTLR